MNEYQNLGRVIQIAFNFLVLFSAFYITQNLSSTVLREENFGSLGFYLIAVLYISLGFSSFISSAIFKKLGTNKCLFIGAMGHTTFVAANILPAYKLDYPHEGSWLQSDLLIIIVLVLSAIFNGFGAAILWCSEGNYLSNCATTKIKGFYFGLFWFIFQLSNVFGNLMGAFILGSGFKLTFLFTILALLALTATFAMICIRKPLQNLGSSTMSLDRQSVRRRSTIEWMTESELPIKVNNTVDITKDTLDDIPDVVEEPQLSFCNNIKVTYDLMVSKRMRFYLAQCFWTGISIAYFSGLVSPIIVRQLPGVEENEQLRDCLFALSVLGVGEMLGALVMGQIVDKISSRAGVIFNLITIVNQFIFSYITIVRNTFDWTSFIFAFSWGFQDGCLNTHCNQMNGFEFDSASDPFSIFNSIQAFAVFAFLLGEGSLDTNDQATLIWYTVSVCSLGLIMCGLTYFFKFTPKQKPV